MELLNSKTEFDQLIQSEEKCAICKDEIRANNYRDYNHMIRCAKMVLYSKTYRICECCADDSERIKKHFSNKL